jgi:RNA recognition motif-containing protein
MTEDELASEFREFGDIQSLKIITDRETGRSRGFGFIEMADDDAQKAIEGLNDSEMGGRQISVSLAQEKKPAYNNNRSRY